MPTLPLSGATQSDSLEHLTFGLKFNNKQLFSKRYPKFTILSGELIVSKYVAESITMIAGRFGHEGLCQLRTELKKLQCEIGYIANTGQWCCVMVSGCINNQ